MLHRKRFAVLVPLCRSGVRPNGQGQSINTLSGQLILEAPSPVAGISAIRLSLLAWPEEMRRGVTIEWTEGRSFRKMKRFEIFCRPSSNRVHLVSHLTTADGEGRGSLRGRHPITSLHRNRRISKAHFLAKLLPSFHFYVNAFFIILGGSRKAKRGEYGDRDGATTASSSCARSNMWAS